MESSRLNIMKEKSPTVLLKNRGNAFTSGIEVGSKGQIEVTFDVVGQKLVMDDNGNEVMRYVLAVSNPKPLIIKGQRL